MPKLRNTIEYIFHYGATPVIFDHAQQLRRNMTHAEAILWEALRNRRFEGLKFRRQHPLSKFIVDFYCHEKRLVVEVDGNIHDKPEVKEYDANREAELKNLGLIIARFTNEEIENDIMNVLERLRMKLT